MTFTWIRGRQLENITFKDDTKATYKYNESGLRIYKERKLPQLLMSGTIQNLSERQ